MALDPLTYHFFLSAFVGNVLYGIYLSIAYACVSIFLRKFWAHSLNYIQLGCFVSLTILLSIKIIGDNVITVKIFTNPLPGDIVHYPSFNAPETVSLYALWIAETAIADFFIMYRAWIVWDRSFWLLVFPTLLLLSSIGAGTYFMYVWAAYGGLELEAFFEVMNPPLDSFLALTLSLNLFCTGLIMYKILTIRRRVDNINVRVMRRDPIQNFLALIIESAVIYTVLLLAGIIVRVFHLDIAYLLFPVIIDMVPIVFGALIVRTSSAGADSQYATSRPTSTLHFANTMGPSFSTDDPGGTTSGQSTWLRLRPVRVRIDDGQAQDSNNTTKPIEVNLDQAITTQGER